MSRADLPSGSSTAHHSGSAAPPGTTATAWLALACEVAAEPLDRAVFAGVALAVGVGYSILLPFDYTQRISLANWRYLDARYIAFAAMFALAMAWLMTLQLHAMRRVMDNATRKGAPAQGSLGALSLVASLLPSFLCCSPVVPTVVGLVGLSATARLRTVGAVQFFFAAEQTPLLLVTAALLLGACVGNRHRVGGPGARISYAPEDVPPVRPAQPPAHAAQPA
jgi:hypothetical protein